MHRRVRREMNMKSCKSLRPYGETRFGMQVGTTYSETRFGIQDASINHLEIRPVKLVTCNLQLATVC
jgi:hypothetical protein